MQLDLVVVAEDVAVGYGYMLVLWYSTLVPWGMDERILIDSSTRPVSVGQSSTITVTWYKPELRIFSESS